MLETYFHQGYRNLFARHTEKLKGRSRRDSGPPTTTSDLNVTFYNGVQNVTVDNLDGAHYQIALDTNTLCDDIVIPNYKNQDSATLGKMIGDLKKPSANTTGFVLDALQAAFDQGNATYFACTQPGGFDGIPAVNPDSSALTVAATLVRNGSTGIAAGITVPFNIGAGAQNPSPSATDVLTVSVGLLTAILFLLYAFLTYTKSNEPLTATHAIILKIFAEWSRSALVTIGSEPILNTPACPTGLFPEPADLNVAAQFQIQDNPVYQQFGLLSGPDLLEQDRKYVTTDKSRCPA